jgi:hypothetical protein
MAQFQTPQFIEREAKVIGPFTFRQAGYLGAPLVLIFFMWFTIAKSSFVLFIAISLLLEGAGAGLAFAKVEGKSIPTLLMNALFFFTKPRTYIWHRGSANIHFREQKLINPHTGGEGLQKADLSRRSRVANLATKVQTKK